MVHSWFWFAVCYISLLVGGLRCGCVGFTGCAVGFLVCLIVVLVIDFWWFWYLFGGLFWFCCLFTVDDLF